MDVKDSIACAKKIGLLLQQADFFILNRCFTIMPEQLVLQN